MLYTYILCAETLQGLGVPPGAPYHPHTHLVCMSHTHASHQPFLASQSLRFRLVRPYI